MEWVCREEDGGGLNEQSYSSLDLRDYLILKLKHQSAFDRNGF